MFDFVKFYDAIYILGSFKRQAVASATAGRKPDSAGIISAVGTSRSATQSKHSQPPAPTKPVHTDSEAQSVGAGGDRGTGQGRTWGQGGAGGGVGQGWRWGGGGLKTPRPHSKPARSHHSHFDCLPKWSSVRPSVAPATVRLRRKETCHA